MGSFGSDSTTKQLNAQRDQRVTLSDQAVFTQDNRKNVGNVVLKGRSSITNNYGADADEIAKLREQFGSVAESITNSGADTPVQTAVEDRAVEQIQAGGEAARQDILGKLGLGNWVLIGLGSLALLGLGSFVILRKAKA